MMTKNHSSTGDLDRSSYVDPHAEERNRYYREMIAEGFLPEDARMIADKTNYNMRTRQSPEAREREPVAIGDFFGHVPKPKPTSKRTQTKIDAQIAIDARADAADKPKPRKRVAEKPVVAVYDYNRYEDLPARVRDLIEAYLAIEKTDAKAAGSLGFMTRALAIATLPHKRVQDHRFMRKNGDFTLTMLTAHPDGLPMAPCPACC
ncbi:hypothetical protein [Mesorhizobium sp. J428]|uniref:hypothetical protein n=1 Tax=Mesorhizobium sp. J428 TaxID=2898440 RepID=UPI002151F488|nr:hypothetical protein [Mesorhizobium sp. J428]MCR5860180.1 hypothetical protein [Mesorhizobium sp. J428]